MTNETKDLPKINKRPFFRMLGILVVFLFVLLIAAIVFPSPILRVVFSRVEARSGISITFDRAYFYLADGSFLAVEGLALRQQNHHVHNFDLRADRIHMPAMFPNDFSSPILYVSGLRGTYERVGSEPAEEGGHQEDTESKPFSLHALMLTNAEVNFIDRTLDKPFKATITAEEFCVIHTSRPSVFEPYYLVTALGQIDSAKLAGATNDEGEQKIELSQVPLGLFAPYAPVLDDIFVSGSVNVHIDDCTDETQKKLRVSIWLLSDCEIKSADEIIAPAIQSALQQLDQSSVLALPELKGKVERLKIFAESLRGDLDRVTQIIDTLKVLAPPNVRQEYENFRSRYDRATAAYDEWNGKFETLVRDLDKAKAGVVEDTFQHFIKSGVPIEIDLQEVEGDWQYDAYDVVVRLVENNYRTFIVPQFRQRFQEIQDAVDRLLVL